MRIFNFLAKTFLFTSAVVLFFSCGKRSRDVQYCIDYLPCEKENTDEMGYLDERGRYISSISDDKELSPVINGFCFVDGTLYKVGDDIADTTPIARDLIYCGVMNDGLIPVCKENEYITILNVKGEIISQIKKIDNKDVLGCFSFSDSKLRVVLEDDTYVYVDKTGQWLFDKSYTWATDFIDGYAVAQTTGQNRDLYSLIDDSGTPVFTFECSDRRELIVSHDMKLLSAIENERIIIYDFKGKRILECPAKVKGIYSFCHTGFIFSNDDEKFGLMAYNGEQLIRSRYKQLVPHGRNYLARTENKEIRLLDKGERILKEYDGNKILDYQQVGFDFPNVIESPFDGYFIIDEEGEIVVEEIDVDFKPREMKTMKEVRSLFFPSDKVSSSIMELCGQGSGEDGMYGAFFYRSGKHCYPNDIAFLSSISTGYLEGRNSARKNIDKGINYDLNYDVVFDEPIIRSGKTSLSTSAWLIRTEIRVWMPNMYSSVAYYNKCIHELRNKGCDEYYSKNGNRILLSTDKRQIFVLFCNWNNIKYEFCIYIMQNTESYRDRWRNYFNNLK